MAADLRTRVAVTGMGVITGAGSTLKDLWRSVIRGESAVHRVTGFDPTDFRSQIAAQVKGFDFSDYVDGTGPGRMDRFSQFAVAAASLARKDAHLDCADCPPESIGTFVGSALGGVAFAEDQHQKYMTAGARSISPSLALAIFAGAAATNISIRFELQGPTISNANSCASGAIAIGEAARRIRMGELSCAIAGGVECPLAPLTFGAFSAIRAMSARNEQPQSACRPFDRDRDGFVMGEGAGILVLENWEQARSRGARIYAEILGYGTTSDAHHMTAPLLDGSQAARAMREALKDAAVSARDIDYVSAHATGTKLGDEAEAVALDSVFADHPPSVGATKPIHGHALGASPAIETVITILAMNQGYIPGILNLEHRDEQCAVSAVSMPGRPATISVALCNAFGFGGINASLVLGKP